jgi:NAD(P)H-dependent FMN reductase
MKTLIISSSLSPDSRSHILCRELQQLLSEDPEVEVQLIDARELDLQYTHQEPSAAMKELTELVQAADNYIISMPVHNYTMSDAVKTITETCFDKSAKGKLFGIVSSAGSQVSYLATAHLVQSMMYEFKMIPFPPLVFATGGSFDGDKLDDERLEKRMSEFARDFVALGGRLV